MRSRRRFLAAGAMAALAPRLAWTQARPVRIGMMAPRPFAESFYTPTIVQRLAELGYRQGGSMILEYRSADGVSSRYAGFAKELIALKCDLVFVVGPDTPVRALRDAGAPMPIVFLAIEYDPVERAVVQKLNRPGSNTTGLFVPANELAAKRLQIMREVVTKAQRFLIFSDQTSKHQLPSVSQAAQSAGLQLTVVEFTGQPYDYAGAFETGRKADVQAFVGLSSGVFAANERAIGALLLKHRLPGIGAGLSMKDAGYLLGFTVDIAKTSRRVADIAARILKGAKAAEIPVEQADEFTLIINGKTAKSLGIKIPESVLARATRIVS